MAADSHFHAGQPVLSTGAPLADARAAVILLHGRGGDARDILGLAQYLIHPQVICLAPNAATQEWYPHRFIEPRAKNEPNLSSALRIVDELIAHLNESGIADERIVVMGFSQGACLTLDYAARYGRKLAGVIAFSGGLIGQTLNSADYRRLDGVPTFIGCSDIDFHIPVGRVEESAAICAELGAAVDKRIYPGMGHTINDEEIAAAHTIVMAAAT